MHQIHTWRRATIHHIFISYCFYLILFRSVAAKVSAAAQEAYVKLTIPLQYFSCCIKLVFPRVSHGFREKCLEKHHRSAYFLSDSTGRNHREPARTEQGRRRTDRRRSAQGSRSRPSRPPRHRPGARAVGPPPLAPAEAFPRPGRGGSPAPFRPVGG
ncbi:hypothetical protein CBM2613_A310014 [Cupriavidus taiwanensis]|uniref:Uncharacterized protein n=1 Tax=Cupriavidus taiwanensis TaxID=164546 RepID=A0A976G2I2_9BURK|nr:hypothetical protein CBM2613_A310014 [Cupriavidus taiwanensis]